MVLSLPHSQRLLSSSRIDALTNITELDGRQIARKVEQISQNNSFVLNR